MLMQQNSDSELSFEASNSSKSSMSSTETCSSSFGRLSFEAATALFENPMSSSPETLNIKPHRSSSDTAYVSIFRRRRDEKQLIFRDFRLLRRIGAGDIGTVFLCRLRDDNEALYAMKVVDKAALEKKKKVQRAEIERKILKMLDHPFLPTMYAEFDASHFSCIVMEYCSGGDLHSLRHKQPHKRFSLSSARFYAAEVLVALEYLHMLGIIYRDLKPENVLVRSDGHIMLSDFDLSLCSDSIPAVESPSTSPNSAYPQSNPYTRTHQTTTLSLFCFPTYRFLFFRSKKIQTLQSNRLFVAEPVNAKSNSFVGTHEYVSPEVASGGAHGNAVDWWAYGIFLYEMIYGHTPFVGASNEDVLRNIVKKPVSFPTDHAPCSMLEYHARDLISKLLNKDPRNRVGSKRGAADVKKHPFFKGMNFALIRTVTPPEIPGLRREKTTPLEKSSGFRCTSSFEFF